MVRLLLRRLALIVVLVPILHVGGYFYAQYHPRFFRGRFERDGNELIYGEYLRDIFTEWDLGNVGGADMNIIVFDRLYNSLILIGFALLITAVVGVLIGIFSVSPKTGRLRPWGLLLTTAGASIPGFLLGGIVVAIFVYRTLYGNMRQMPLPMSGVAIDEHLILPLVVLAVRPTLQLARMTAGLLEEEMHKDYVRTARSKGLRWIRVMWKHALRNIFAPIIVIISQSLRFIVGGLLIAEIMFSWPGIGQLFVFTMVANENMGAQFRFFAHPELIATLAALVGFILLTADLLSALGTYAVDPRQRRMGG